jgi:hypothetical protein
MAYSMQASNSDASGTREHEPPLAAEEARRITAPPRPHGRPGAETPHTRHTPLPLLLATTAGWERKEEQRFYNVRHIVIGLC